MQLASLTIIFQSVAVPLVAEFQTMLPQSSRPRAADDFATIRSRMEELRCERARLSVGDVPRPIDEMPPYASTRPSLANKVVFPPVVIRPPSRR